MRFEFSYGGQPRRREYADADHDQYLQWERDGAGGATELSLEGVVFEYGGFCRFGVARPAPRLCASCLRFCLGGAAAWLRPCCFV